uniref:Centrosomal protein 95 n=1 Tax=Scophthalmus maximus TaxID=52904 RepID=A0A8D3DWB8_SCOMX
MSGFKCSPLTGDCDYTTSQCPTKKTTHNRCRMLFLSHLVQLCVRATVCSDVLLEDTNLSVSFLTTDWVDVANDLFTKCHMNLRLRHLTDCDANVFSALYENIFGEKVPDYIAAPCSQEDDIHNIQSVIDSLSLDYLQISLSHITGENVVRGDKESIKNLLEIFDGLLEYLNEEISGDSLNGEELSNGLNELVLGETKESASCDATEHKETKREGTSLSSSVE